MNGFLVKLCTFFIIFFLGIRICLTIKIEGEGGQSVPNQENVGIVQEFCLKGYTVM